MRPGLSLFATLLVFIGSVAHAQNKVVFSVPGIIIPDLPIHYAVHGGFMAKHGLDAHIQQTDRRDLATIAVISGDAVGSVTDPIEAAIAFRRGAGLKVVAGVAVNAPPFIIGDKTVTADQKSWKGKTASLFTPPNTLYTLFMRELQNGGWKEVESNVYRLSATDSSEQYLRISLGKRGTELPALLANRANLAVLHEPDASTAVVRGNMHVVKAFAGSFKELLWSTLNVSSEAMKKRPDVIARVVAGLNDALASLHESPERVTPITLKMFPSADASVMARAVEGLVKAGIFPKSCMVTPEGWAANIGLLKLTNPAAPATDVSFSEIADMSFCKAAVARKK